MTANASELPSAAKQLRYFFSSPVGFQTRWCSLQAVEKQQFPCGRSIQANGEQLHQRSHLVRYDHQSLQLVWLDNSLLWHSGCIAVEHAAIQTSRFERQKLLCFYSSFKTETESIVWSRHSCCLPIDLSILQHLLVSLQWKKCENLHKKTCLAGAHEKKTQQKKTTSH